MKALRLKPFGLILLDYILLCLSTWLFCRQTLEARFVERAWGEWEPIRAWEKTELLKTDDLHVRRRFLDNYEMEIFRSGPNVRTEILYCIAPTILRARSGMRIGSRAWCDADGWYAVTPWGTWTIWESFSRGGMD